MGRTDKLQRIVFRLLVLYLLATVLGAATLYFVPESRVRWRWFRGPVQEHPPRPEDRWEGTPNTLADELTDFLEERWRERYAVRQKRYRFDANTSTQELIRIAERVRGDFREWIQNDRPHQRRFTELVRETVSEDPEYVLHEVRFKNANGLTIEGLLSIPRRNVAPYAAVVIPNGTLASAREIFGLSRSDYHSQVGKRLAADFVVFAVNVPPTTTNFKEATASNDRNFFLSNSAGLNWRYYQIVDKVSSAVDYLEEVPEADMDRLAVYGISLGGAAAVFSSVCDPRISVTAVSGTNVFTPNDVQLLENRRFVYPHFYLHNIVARPDLHQLLYALFPRPVIVEMNRQDTTGVFAAAIRAVESVELYYQRRGAGQRVRKVIFDGDKRSNGHYMEVVGVKRALDDFLRARDRPLSRTWKAR